jgi:hypothetical protein
MPPRFAYWTILIDDQPTAFRARDRDELTPTFAQLKRTNDNVVMKWFAQGRLWESQEAQRAAAARPKPDREKRSRDWRPGGVHKDPRARFDKQAQRRRKREERAPRSEWNAHRPDRQDQRSRPPQNPARPFDRRNAPNRDEHRPHRPRDQRPRPRDDERNRKREEWRTQGARGAPHGRRPPQKPRGRDDRNDQRPRWTPSPKSNWKKRRREDEPPDRG